MAHFLNQTFTCAGSSHQPEGGDIARLIIIIIVMIIIIIGNVCCLAVFNSAKTKKYFPTRARYSMTSLCITDLSMGILVCPSTLYSALYHCWPFGEVFCRIEALLLSALYSESTINMVLIAVDRYFLIHYPYAYNKRMTSHRYMYVIIATWIVVFVSYAIVILGFGQFYFDVIGINCEPFYENRTVTLTIISIFYFVPTFIFIFSYASIYRTATKRRMMTISKTNKTEKLVNANIRTSKYLAAITLGFFIAATPWNLMTLIMVAAQIPIEKNVDFIITWLAISNSFWNCLIYGVTNRKFRMAAANFACGRWIKSLHILTTTASKAEDSKDWSDNSGLDSNNRRRLTKKTPNAFKVSELTTPGPPSRQSPSISPIASPKSSPMASPLASPKMAVKSKDSGFSHELHLTEHQLTDTDEERSGTGYSNNTAV